MCTDYYKNQGAEAIERALPLPRGRFIFNNAIIITDQNASEMPIRSGKE